MKRLISIIAVLLLLPFLALSWLLTTESGLRWAYKQAHAYLPGELSITELEGRLIGPITLKGIEFKQNGMLVKTDQVNFDWRPATLLTARFDINRLHVQSLNIILPQTDKTAAPLTLPDIYLPWRLALNDIVINALSINNGGQTFDLQQIKLNANTLLSQIDIEQFSIIGDNFSLNLSGEVRANRNYRHALETNWQVNLSSNEIIQGRGQLAGNIKTTRLKQQLSGPLPATLDVELNNLLGQFNWQASADVNDTHIQAHGDWLASSNGDNMTMALSWQNLRWPLTGTTWFDSAIGSGWIVGNLDHFRLGIATDRPWSQAPSSFWYASADGDLTGLNFHSLRITTLEGEANARGQLDWSPQLVWQAQITASDINPKTLWPEWPGQLNATLTSTGHYENGQLISAADISQLEGTLRGYPVSLRSRLAWRDNGLDINRFDFRSGDSLVTARGRVADTVTLDWAISTTDLAELYPHTGGQLRAEGLLSGPRTTPTIRATLNGQALSLQDYRVATLDGFLNVDLLRWQQLNINLAAQALELKGYSLQSLSLSTNEGRIYARAITDRFTTTLELKGEADTQGWRGQIERADIDSEQFHDWRLKAPVSINLDAKTISLEPLCWFSNNNNLCLTLQRKDSALQASLNAGQMPLQLFTPLLPADLTLDGVASASAEINYQDSELTGQATITLPPGAVNYPLLAGELERWQYDGGTVTISLDDQGISAFADLVISNGDRFHAKFELPQAKPLSLNQQQSLRAEAHLTVHDIRLIGALIPEVEDLQGEVALNLSASGTLARPILNGRAHLLNGALRIPRLGLDIDQVRLHAQSDNMEKLNFQLDARSDEGNLNIEGQTILDRPAGWPTKISITGKDFQVSSIPEARVLVSPNLQVSLKQRTIDIKGDVHIPYAKLQPKDITTAARVSEDAVIVGGELPEVEKWSILSQVRVTLGERVNFFGFGFEGRFGGSLLLHDEPGQLTTATGELTVAEGRYRAYGQRLDVEHGRLLYTGGPLSNPGLDMRAVRHVGNVTAGLKVWGSLNQPQIELFSIPAMGQTDTLAYLMLGHPIENASGEEGAMMAKAALALGLSGGDSLARALGDRFGLDEMRVETSDTGDQASLVMGRYLSSKLYISYGVGLIEAFNTFTVRYQISDKWQLKGESGEYQGADLLYTIER